MLVLATDYGVTDPYVGQLKLAAAAHAPGVPVIDLCHHLPPFDARRSAHLLAAWAQDIPAGAVVVAVVDPGVGDPARKPVAVRTDRHWWVGPGNGLFDVVARRAPAAEWFEIVWRSQRMSASFHGRDLFAPVGAQLAAGVDYTTLLQRFASPPSVQEDADIFEIIYVDHFGNAMTGVRANNMSEQSTLRVKNRTLHFARTFSAAPPDTPFWYVNAQQLVEVSIDQGNAAARLGLRIGDGVTID